MKTLKLIYKVFVGATVGYTTHRMLSDKADALLDNGGMLNAFVIGAGQTAISIAAGIIAAEVNTKQM